MPDRRERLAIKRQDISFSHQEADFSNLLDLSQDQEEETKRRATTELVLPTFGSISKLTRGRLASEDYQPLQVIEEEEVTTTDVMRRMRHQSQSGSLDSPDDVGDIINQIRRETQTYRAQSKRSGIVMKQATLKFEPQKTEMPDFGVQKEFQDSNKSSSEDSQDEAKVLDDDLNIQRIIERAKNAPIHQEIRRKMLLYEKAIPVDLIDANERDNIEERLTEIENAKQLLMQDSIFDKLPPELLLHSAFDTISRKLFSESESPYFGRVNYIRAHRFKSSVVLFVGTYTGYIRTFCSSTQVEKKPLFTEALKGKTVLAFDIEESGKQLAAVYSGGTIVLWNLKTFKTSHVMKQMTKTSASEFNQVKIASECEGGDTTHLITGEQAGTIRCVTIKKTLFGGFVHQARSLYEDTVVPMRLIAQFKCRTAIESPTISYCKASSLVAFAGENNVAFVQLTPMPPRQIDIYSRPCFSEPGCQPCVSWGFGISTRSSQEEAGPLVAVAWDQVIQLLSVQTQELNGKTKVTLTPSGFYCSDAVVNQVYFMGESVLVVLVNTCELRVLSTKRFRLGDAKELTKRKQFDVAFKQGTAFNKTIEICRKAEIQNSYMIEDLKAEMCHNAQMFLLRKSIYIVGDLKIYEARLLSWNEYLNKLRFNVNQNWITVLKTAVEVFQGRVEGLASLPCDKKRREETLRPYLRSLLMTAISKSMRAMKNNSQEKQGVYHQKEYQFRSEEVAVKIAIEFCILTGDPKFFFEEVYRSFAQFGQEMSLLKQIWTILKVKSLRLAIPLEILRKIVQQFVDNRDFKDLDKLICNINLDAYGQDSNGSVVQVREYLESICNRHSLVVALEHLQTSVKSNSGAKGCRQVLALLIKHVRDQEASELKVSSKLCLAKKDLVLLRNAHAARKKQIESSSYYLKYRLFWIINIFLSGEKFSDGKLTAEQHVAHVRDVVDFMTQEQTLDFLLDFDPEAFFSTCINLFKGDCWKVLTKECNEYRFRFQSDDLLANSKHACQVKINRAAVQSKNINLQKGTLRMSEVKQEGLTRASICNIKRQLCEQPVINSILQVFKDAVVSEDRRDPNLTLTCFLELLLGILVAQSCGGEQLHSSETISGKSQLISQVAMTKSCFTLDYTWVLTAIKTVLQGKRAKQEDLEQIIDRTTEAQKNIVNQDLLVKTLRIVKLEREDVDEILNSLDQLEGDWTPTKVALYENKREYDEALIRLLNDTLQKKDIFAWLTRTFAILEKEEALTRHNMVQLELRQKTFIKGDLSSSSEDSHYFSGDEVLRTPKRAAQDPESQIECVPYRKLRDLVKNRIAELGQIDSKQTASLVRQYFKHSQEQIIMNSFEKYEEEQFQFLEQYLRQNEALISHSIAEKDVAHHEKQAVKFEKYLILFTKLLCKLRKPSIEDWVSKPAFPPGPCLLKCKEYGNLKGQAVLLQRVGRPLEAVTVFIKILQQIPLHKLIEQVILIYKFNKPDFLPLVSLDEIEGTLVVREQTKEQKVSNYLEPAQVTEFDHYLGQACRVCLTEDLDYEQRHKAWFRILKFLQKFKEESAVKVMHATHKAIEEAGGNPDFASLSHKDADRENYRHALECFLVARINKILYFPWLDIPIKRIMEELNLTFNQIKELCTVKLRHNETNLRIEKCQQGIIQGQLMDTFTDLFAKMSTGYTIDQFQRTETTASGKTLIKGSSVCSSCKNPLVQEKANQAQETALLYQCAHRFHDQCLRDLRAELKVRKCPICVQKSYLAVRELKDRQERKQLQGDHKGASHDHKTGANKRRGFLSEEEEDEEDLLDDESLGDSDDEDQFEQIQRHMEDRALAKLKKLPPEDPSFRSDLICDHQARDECRCQLKREIRPKPQEARMQRKMEQYDEVLDDINLELSEFQAMIAE